MAAIGRGLWKSRKLWKSFFIVNALLLSALVVCVFIAYFTDVITGTVGILDRQNEYTQNNPDKQKTKVETHTSLPDSLKAHIYREATQALTIASTYEEARRLLKDYAFEDIMNMKPIRYLDSFKNPCWMGTKDNGPVNDNKMHCLPYFFVIGVKKSGTSDLFSRIQKHPEVITSLKEFHWFPRRRFFIEMPMTAQLKKAQSGYDPRELSYYIHMFDTATNSILSAREGNNNVDMITGEGTPSNLHLQGLWDLLPGNKGLSEPRYTNIHYIKHLIPQAKIIIIFRNPVDRLFSDFHHTAKVRDSHVFHEQAATMVQMYQNCFSHHSFRQCIYNNTFTNVYQYRIVSPAVGFYAFFMKELRSVFPKNQILPLLFDDYVTKPIETLTKVYSFLELRSLDDDHMQKIIKAPIRNSGEKKKAQSGPMLEETRKMLNDFYRSSNEEMAELMRDNRYLFSEK